MVVGFEKSVVPDDRVSEALGVESSLFAFLYCLRGCR